MHYLGSYIIILNNHTHIRHSFFFCNVHVLCGNYIVFSLQVSTGWIPMEAAPSMLSRSSVTLKTAPVPLVSIPKTGYVLY